MGRSNPKCFTSKPGNPLIQINHVFFSPSYQSRSEGKKELVLKHTRIQKWIDSSIDRLSPVLPVWNQSWKHSDVREERILVLAYGEICNDWWHLENSKYCCDIYCAQILSFWISRRLEYCFIHFRLTLRKLV